MIHTFNKMFVTLITAVTLALVILTSSQLIVVAEENSGHFQVLNIWLNGIDTKIVSPVLTVKNTVYISSDTLKKLGLHPSSSELLYDQIQYQALSNISNVTFSISPPQLRLHCPSSCFNIVRLNIPQLHQPRQLANNISPGAGTYVNYDFIVQKINPGKTFLRGYLQAGGGLNASRWRTDGIFRHGGTTTQFRRLESSWIAEWPDMMRQLVLGDSVSNTATWARPYRFLGIQYGTDYSLQPDLITHPLPNIMGDASLPSIVDLIVNGQHLGSGQIEPGPFETGALPLIVGSSQVQLAIRDILGRESFITENIYIAPQLLQKGLTEFTFQGGLLRQNFSAKSFDYGNLLISGRLRKGITDRITVETYAEADSRAAVMGSSVFLQPSFGGVVSFASAVSLNSDKAPMMASTSYERLSQNLGLRMMGEWRSADFRLPSSRQSFGAFLTRYQFIITQRIGGRFSLSTGYIYNKSAEHLTKNIINTTASVNIFENLHVNFNLRQIYGTNHETFAGIFLSMPLGNGHNISSSVQRTGSGGTRMSLFAHRTPDRVEGIGYRAEVTQGDQPSAEGTLQWRKQDVDLDVGVSRRSDLTALRASARGSIILWQSGIKASRYLFGSYAMVDAPTMSNARVYHDSQYVGRLDDDGKMLVTNLRPLERNLISIEPRDLKPGLYLETYSQTVQPQRFSGATVNFGKQAYSSIIIVLQTPDGKQLPFGTKISSSNGKSFVVGRNGRVNILYPVGHYRMSTYTQGHQCGFNVDVRPDYTKFNEEVIVCKADTVSHGENDGF